MYFSICLHVSCSGVLIFILMGKVNMLCPYIIAGSSQRTSGFLMTFTQTLELSVAVRVPHAFFFFNYSPSHSLKTVASLCSSILERSTPRKIFEAYHKRPSVLFNVPWHLILQDTSKAPGHFLTLTLLSHKALDIN